MSHTAGRPDRTARGAALATIALVVALVAALAAPTTTASAAPPAQPGSLNVQQPDDSSNILTWAAVAGATRYEVQVDDDPAFGSTYLSVSTVNTSFVPPMNLAGGTIYWRVRAFTGAEASAWSGSEFGKAPVARPTPVAPTNGTTLAQPINPPLLSWTAVPGAIGYKVEVDDADDFVGAMSFETRTTSLVVDRPLSAAPWFWRVSALKGPTLQSLPSDTATFTVLPLPSPTRTSPPDDANLELQDVVLDWDPVPGAKSYDIQVSTSEDFTQGASLIETKTGIVGTRYSPATTYDNNQYFWRVRAVDLDDRATAWSPARSSFNRTWPDVPTLVFPAAPGNEVVGASIYFQWESVRHASEYEIQIGTQPNFTVGTFESCRVAGTTYLPGQFAVNTTGQPSTNRENEDCEPQQGQLNYWRVRPLDRPFTKAGDIPGVQGIYSETQAFLYQPVSIAGRSPSGGQTVAVPTFSWTPVIGAERYEVEVATKAGTVVGAAETKSPSWTIPGTARLDPADNPHTWRVRAITTKGQSSVLYFTQFNIAGEPPTTDAEPLTPLTPTSSTTGIKHAPQLTWEPMPGAHHYSVDIGTAMDTGQIWFGTSGDNLFRKSVPYPAMTDTSDRLLLPGQYDWQVKAYDEDNAVIGTGPEGRFTVEDVALTTGHEVALDGAAVAQDNTANACTPGEVCTVPSTPVLRWTPDPYAAFYMVYVSEDASFTNLLEPSNRVPATTSNMYVPTLDNDAHTYADSQAGGAYYWYARPCRNRLNCGPDPVSTIGKWQHSFVKRSPKVTGLQSTSPSGTEITFRWDDYFDTNRSAQWPQTNEDRPQAAMRYRIQVNNVESFAGTLVDERLVDQTTYTAPDELYPEGPLFWRVQAVDSDANGLAWSDVQSFTKASPQVPLQSPVGNLSVSSRTPFRWQPQAFASSYDLEVFKNDDATFSTANRVVNRPALKTTAYAHTDPLPASPSAYRWRVRRTDAEGNKGPWSVTGRFFVGSQEMNPLAPVAGVSQRPNGPVLQWAPLEGARNYNVSITPLSPGGTSVSTQSTVASAYAAQVNFVTGNYQWTVTARDAADNVIGSATATFTVDAGLQIVQGPQIEATGGTGVGQVVTSVPPAWSEPGVVNSYQWLRDGAKISGATNATYTLTTADFGKSISLQVTGSKPGFASEVAISNVIGATAGGAPQCTELPAISGTPSLGSRLTGSRGTWSGQGTISYSYAWLRDGVLIPGATSTSYTPTEADLSRDLVFRVTASANGYADGLAHSAPVRVQSLLATSLPQVSAPSGTGVGATLVAVAPTWNQPDVATSFQWLRSGAPISGATAPTYVLTAADLGKEVSLRATGSKTGFQDAVAVSGGVTATASGALQATTPPSVTGTPSVGQTLKAAPGTWSQPSPTFRYQWLRTGAAIPGATSSTYRLMPEDAGKDVSVVVSATKTGFADGAAASAAVPVARMTSTVSGSLKADRVKVGKKAKITVTLSVSGMAAPNGTVQVLDKGKKVASFTMAPVHKGKKTLTLAKLKKGKHKLQVVYLGTSEVLGSKSKKIVLYIVK
ncbi:Ig-like domain repeat protein [Nocardioides sp. zg-1308]|uniref:Ig-like domain repeat protein n=1 Tax=Nocardioides renjunii TaxID=3095075 RepID=A0ABU5KFT4_9ACTN|nr:MULTISPECIES: Ig-like domain repeat protein [unclassified Nocardioides]MDZ5663825.1 Ig-like domain repeat protein [Nocardioides sp. S-58]NPD06746.1 Ig-like domain repeat protein [Nocardioides sp. zg-1308]